MSEKFITVVIVSMSIPNKPINKSFHFHRFSAGCHQCNDKHNSQRWHFPKMLGIECFKMINVWQNQFRRLRTTKACEWPLSQCLKIVPSFNLNRVTKKLDYNTKSTKAMPPLKMHTTVSQI